MTNVETRMTKHKGPKALMFRFTIRDMFWLLLVIAMGVGWWMDRRRILDIVRQQSPMLYEGITGHGIDTNDPVLKARSMRKYEEQRQSNNQGWKAD
jgi:hypothetical protein